MSERSGTARTATARRGHHPARRVWVLALLAAVWAGAPGTVQADEIVLRSGESIEGTIVDATRNTVVVRRAIGGMRQMRIRDIEEVRIDLVGGDRIFGQLMSWAQGVHQVRSGDEVLRIREGRLLSRAPYEEAGRQQPPAVAPQRQVEPTVGTAAPPPAASSPEGTADESAAQKAAAERAAAQRAAAERAAAEREAAEREAAERAAAEKAAAEREAAERAAAERAAAEKAAAEREAAERAAAERAAAERATAERPDTESAGAREAEADAQAVAIETSVDVEEAGTPGVVFRIELSRPAEKTVVLIYGTVDGTAKAGEDYEPRQGVLTLAPGTRSADVRVPLIEPRRVEGDARFELFLTADPKVATIADQRVTAIIPGDS
jgi:Calx-beta domain